MTRTYPHIPFERYADDAICHCKTAVGNTALALPHEPNPANTCWPEPVPFLFKHAAMEMLQLPDRIVMLFNENHEVCRVRLNAPHPAELTPSWHGDAVGLYQGDTLVIDTAGVRTDRPTVAGGNVRPQSTRRALTRGMWDLCWRPRGGGRPARRTHAQRIAWDRARRPSQG
jgi:hypothetical protein